MRATFLCLYLFVKFLFHVLPPPPPHTDSGKLGFEKEREKGEGVNHINLAPPTYPAETNGAPPPHYQYSREYGRIHHRGGEYGLI